MKNTSGFTMVELLMTITLAAILGTVASTQFIDFRTDAKIATTNKRMFELREALTGNPELIANGQFVKPGIIVDLGSVPTALSAMISQGAYSSFNLYEKHGWRGPYVDSNVTDWSKDAWSTTFSYHATSRWIKSCGPDAICAGGNAADDITLPF